MNIWENCVEFLHEHYQWLFSGIGVFLLGGLFSLFKRKQSSGQNQNVKNGTALQIGRDLKINRKN